jgi:alkylation response protein AidB-like acyl-CoA dehydrogenase
MEGKIRSCFGMTEPMVASSDATNVECRIERDGDEYVINGRKWWTSGAMDPRCKLCILMGKTDLRAPPHKQQSMVSTPARARLGGSRSAMLTPRGPRRSSSRWMRPV